MVKILPLNDDELRKAEAVIQNAAPGVYILADLYGSSWPTRGQTTLGRRFRIAVTAKRLIGITECSKKTVKNHTQYCVHAR